MSTSDVMKAGWTRKNFQREKQRVGGGGSKMRVRQVKALASSTKLKVVQKQSVIKILF